MAADFRKIARRLAFRLETHSLGTIHCGSLTSGAFSKIEEELQSDGVNSVIFARRLLQEVGRNFEEVKRNEDEDDKKETRDKPLTAEDISRLSDGDIQHFSREFIAHNKWLLRTYKDAHRAVRTNKKGEKVISVKPTAVDFPKDNTESYSDYLVRVFRRYQEEQAESLKKITNPLSSSLFGNKFSSVTEGLLMKHVTLSDQLRKTLRGIEPKFTEPYIDSTIEPRHLDLPDLQIQENPAHGTNRRLDDVLDHAVELQPIILHSVELFRNMSDTVLQMHADFSESARQSLFRSFVVICIATASLFVTALYSWWSYEQSSVQEAQYERTFRDQQAQIQTLLEQQDERYLQLLSNHANQIQTLLERQDPQDQRTIESIPPINMIESESAGQ